MQRATITEVKNGLSALIDRVRAGESIVVTDRGIAVAVIEPVTDQLALDDRIARLERAGLARRGSGQVVREMLQAPRPKVRGPGNPGVDAVIQERREGR